ncbi:MAG: MASE3 domain-containing protein [Candidatus Dojkabacteria bacterium]|jgi:hypothetical protein
MIQKFTKRDVKKKEIVILLTVIFFLIFGYVAGSLKWIQDFQLIVDLLAGIFAFFIGTLALLRFFTKKNSFNYLLLGIGFVVVATLDVSHILLTLNIFTDLFNVSNAEIFPNSVVFSRVFLALTFFLSWIFVREEHRKKSMNERFVLVAILLLFTVFTILISIFSNIFNNQKEYIFAIIGQTVAMMIYILTLIGYLRGRGIYYRSFDFWLIFSLTFAILSQIFFLPFLNIEYYLMLNLSTVAKFISYLVLLIGFLYSIYEMYKSEEDTQRELTRRNLLLTETKKKVEEAYMILRDEKWAITKGKGSVDEILKDILKKK